MLTGAAVAALFVLLALAARCDLASRRIPNRLTLAGGAAGLLLAASQGGWGALGEAALGGLAGLGVLLPVWLLGGMGAGDVKLLGAAGTFLGVPLVFWGATCSAVAGGLLAIAVLSRRGVASRTAANLRALLGFWIASRGIRRAGWLTTRHPSAVTIPYGAAIALGCGFAALFPGLSTF